MRALNVAILPVCLLAAVAIGCSENAATKDDVLVQTKKMMIGRWTNQSDPGEVLEIDDATIKRFYNKEAIDNGNAYELSLSPCEARIDSARAAGQVYLKESSTAGDPLCYLAVATKDYLELIYTANGQMHSYRREP